jgi:hypothetical protein
MVIAFPASHPVDLPSVEPVHDFLLGDSFPQGQDHPADWRSTGANRHQHWRSIPRPAAPGKLNDQIPGVMTPFGDDNLLEFRSGSSINQP